MTIKHIIALLASTVSFATLAADTVNINITGNVIASPCIVNGGLANLDVPLGDIQANTLFTAGSSSPVVPFTISLTSCPVGTSTVLASFTGTADPAAGVNYYKNNGTASNVAVALKQATPNNFKGTGTSITSTVQADKSASIPMQAYAYSSAGSATPGTISAVVVASMQYN